MSDFGYGVNLSHAKYRDDAAAYIVEHFLTKDLKHEFEEFCEEHPELDKPEAAQEFVDSWTDKEGTLCYDGIESLLCRCMNDNECGGYNKFSYEDCCVYVGARIPKNDADKAEMLTMEDIQRILVKYFSSEHVLKEPVNIEFLDIDTD